MKRLEGLKKSAAIRQKYTVVVNKFDALPDEGENYDEER